MDAPELKTVPPEHKDVHVGVHLTESHSNVGDVGASETVLRDLSREEVRDGRIS